MQTGYEGVDYVRVREQLSWSQSENQNKEIVIEIIDDDVWEIDECFWIELDGRDHRNGENRIQDKAKICIRDDDDPGNCTDAEWTEWSHCQNDSFGIVQVFREKLVSFIDNTTGNIDCETVVESEICIGGLC